MKVEKEHSHLFAPNKKKFFEKKIVLDHIKEFPCYYSKGLIPMELKLREFERRKK